MKNDTQVTSSECIAFTTGDRCRIDTVSNERGNVGCLKSERTVYDL